MTTSNEAVVNGALEERREREIELQQAKAAWRENMASRFKPRAAHQHELVGAMLVIRNVKKAQTVGGILMPEASQEMPGQGVIVAAGEGAQFKKGDQVFFSKHCGALLELPDGTLAREFRVLNEDEVWGSWPAEMLGEREPAKGDAGWKQDRPGDSCSA